MKTQQSIYDESGKEDVRITTTPFKKGFFLSISTGFDDYSYSDLIYFLTEVMKDNPHVIEGFTLVEENEEEKIEQFLLVHEATIDEEQVQKWRNHSAQTKIIESTYND
ncbi:MAG: hypothetical protein WC617_05160 [Rhodanobacter sp.]|jgi:hypothetical protein